MAFNKQRLDDIFRKTDGRCHICRKKLVRKNYGVVRARSAWEAEHSVPKAKGGTDHLNNLYPACISCNRSKGAASTKVARTKHGFKAAPLSKEKKTGNTWFGGFGGALLGAPFGPIGVLAGAVVGAIFGDSHEPN